MICYVCLFCLSKVGFGFFKGSWVLYKYLDRFRQVIWIVVVVVMRIFFVSIGIGFPEEKGMVVSLWLIIYDSRFLVSVSDVFYLHYKKWV